MKTISMFICLLIAAKSVSGQNPAADQPNTVCIVLSAGKSRANNAETAFCNVCNYSTNGTIPYKFDVGVTVEQQGKRQTGMAFS